MSAQFMRRNIRISVRLTEEEHRLLKEKMARIGVTNQEAFLRKMALDGLVIRLDLPELKQMISLLRYTSNNINQIAKRLNESGRAYDTDGDSGKAEAAMGTCQQNSYEAVHHSVSRQKYTISPCCRHPCFRAALSV